MNDKQSTARIFIADSNTLVREKMKEIIADNFKSVLTYEASSESEVLDEISRHTFDVLILDLELSGDNGFTLLKKIMLVAPDIPVVVMSMFSVKQYEEGVLREGAYGYVSKVSIPNELIGALKKLFHGKNYFASQHTDDRGDKSS